MAYSKNLTLEENYFIHIVNDHINQTSTEQCSGISWSSLFDISKNHEVTGIVYYQCRDFIPEEYTSLFEQSYAATMFYNMNRKRCLDKIVRELDLNGIGAVSVKGLEIAQYYPFPILRSMGDNDIVIEPGKMKETVRILTNMGLVGSDDTETDSWSGNWNDLSFEVHDTLVKREEYTNNKQVLFFNDYTKYIQGNNLDWSFHFLFLLMHLRKHFMAHGVGLRQFIDIAVVIMNCSELNWNWIEEKIVDLNLQKFAHSCFSLILYWFGIRAPICFEELKPTLLEKVTEIVINNGVFGFSSDDNRENGARNELIHAKGPMWYRRLVLFIKKAFPNYEYMKKYPKCNFIRGKPYLLPVSWLVRFVYSIKDNDNTSRYRTIQSTFISSDDVDRRKALFEELGLY